MSIETDKGNGTGFLVENGYFAITCAHVIEDATRIKIKDHKGRTLPVVKLNINKATDTAILLLASYPDQKPLPYVSTDKVNPGDPIVVIGNPLGFLSQTLTTGIVSGKRIDGDAKLIQIDAAISPGSSGSPIINAYGEVVGMVSFTFTRGQSLNMGVAFSEVVKGAGRGFRTYEDFLATNITKKSAPGKEVAAAAGGRLGISSAPAAEGEVAPSGGKNVAVSEVEGTPEKRPGQEAAMRYYARMMSDAYKPFMELEIQQAKWASDDVSDALLISRCSEANAKAAAALSDAALDAAPEGFASAAMRKSLAGLRSLTTEYTREMEQMCLAYQQDREDDYKAHTKETEAKRQLLFVAHLKTMETLGEQEWYDMTLFFDNFSPPVMASLVPQLINTVVPEPGSDKLAVIGNSGDGSVLRPGDIITRIKKEDASEWTDVRDWEDVVGFLHAKKVPRARVVVSRDGTPIELTAVFHE